MSAARVFGFHPVREALRRRSQEVERVLVADRRQGKRAVEIEALCRKAGVAVSRLPTAELDKRVGGVHNGFVAEIRESAGEGDRHEGGDPELVVLLEDVQDPRNLGAVLRVCEGAGVGRVLIRDRGSAPLSPTTVKASAGAAEWVAVDRVPNTAAALAALKDAGFWVFGADAEGDPVWEADLTGKVVLCLGGEGTGLRHLTKERCDRLVALPMRGRVGSLNVSAAASALLYEAVRQRLAAAGDS